MEKRRASRKSINNAFYDELGDLWHTEHAHPIALLRAENRLRIPWIIKTIEEKLGPHKKILDIGCGGGFLTNALANAHHEVTGIDLSKESLAIAAKNDVTTRVIYLQASAEELPFPSNSFDVVSALDLLEHVEDPAKVVAQASKVLKPNGLFFFHTFNRTLLSYLMVIKGVELFVPNSPRDMHLLRLFITPKELTTMCETNAMEVKEIRGMRPSFSKGLLKLILQRHIEENFQFVFSKSLSTGYCGFATKS